MPLDVRRLGKQGSKAEMSPVSRLELSTGSLGTVGTSASSESIGSDRVSRVHLICGVWSERIVSERFVEVALTKHTAAEC